MRKGYKCVIVMVGVVLFLVSLWLSGHFFRKQEKTPKELLTEYMSYIPERDYGAMYAMLSPEAAKGVSQEDFITRNKAIYEGIEVQDLTVEIKGYDRKNKTVAYETSMDTIAGKISFENEAIFQRTDEGYGLIWSDSMIFPELSPDDKVRVSVTEAERGEILDRNGQVLAGKGIASSVGVIPGKLEDKDNAIQEIAMLLGIEQEEIKEKLSAQWVKEDSFVPKVKEIELTALEPEQEVVEENERQEKLLEIPGVRITDTEVREYPLEEAAAHLTGYVQSVTAEDLEEHAGEGYTSNSVIGRSGMEGLFEKELKGQNGYKIYIEDVAGNEKMELASVVVENGKSIQLTIDADLQRALYEQFREDKSCSVAMDPYTGEVLALISTPSYDNNAFIRGLSNEQWTALNEDENQPLYNRFRQTWCPGSTLKPVIAAIGLETGAIHPDEDYGNEGLSWQKDESWGSYYVTTLHEYEPDILENALIYSDNIYFAKAALRIGAGELQSYFDRLGFGEELPFEIQMTKSQYSNSEEIETEIQLADSGYGQGQILINPLHLACIYTVFCNEGNMRTPCLVLQQEPDDKFWIPEVFSEKTVDIVREGLVKVVNDPNGTGYGAHREDMVLAGKTGTAEIKASQEDTTGTELGWFAVFTAEETTERPILLVSMVEDVKERGGSSYVVGKDREVLENWFGKH